MATEFSGQNLNGAAVGVCRRMSPLDERGLLASIPDGPSLSSAVASFGLPGGEPACIEAARGDPACRQALISELRRRLAEATYTLEAIQSGSVDAVVVNAETGPQIFSLESPEHPFRTFVESMQEGALTLNREGTILYANGSFAALCGRSVQEVLGTALASLVVPDERVACAALMAHGLAAPIEQSLRLESPEGGLPVQLTLSPLASGGQRPAHHYDVLLSDLGLPDRDGLELLRTARERGRSGSELRAVALTGYGTEADARSCVSAGFELHLVKPITPRDLAAAIIQLLQRPANSA
jgi:PAS domain S-box-containing protein